MDFELSPEIRQAMDSINFIERYVNLSKKYSVYFDDRFRDYDS